jgi:virulence factor Mce-like protein
MRRLLALALVPLVAAGALALSGARARGDSAYRVDVIFDTSKGIIPGQLVKIAGARVGTVKDVSLTRDYKARIQMEVERRFAPFRSDAACSIQPEGLLAENFVQCDPGTPNGRPLRAHDGKAPTVPVDRTTVPVNLNDLFDIWNVPARERLTVLINELGIGFAGRGEDFNEVLRRANPSLALARRAITTLNRQRGELQGIITSSDRVVGELAARRDRVGDFLDQAARVSAQTAQHSGALGESIRRLPPLLRATRPALQRLDEFSAAGTPLLRSLRAAAPQVNRLIADIAPFADAGLPAIRGLAPAFATALKATRKSGPLMKEIRAFTTEGLPLGPLVSRSFVSLRDRGFIENGLKFIYYAASSTARYDSVSHILPAHVLTNECARYATSPVAGCDAHMGKGATLTALSKRPPTAGRKAPAAPRRAGQAPTVPAPAPQPSPRPAQGPKPPVQVPSVQELVDGIVNNITQPDDQRRRNALEDLAGYLLK